MKGKTIIIGGGSGFIGSHLYRLLINQGYSVTIISRMPGPNRMSWRDLDERGLPSNTHAVVNLAGQNVLDPLRRWTAGFKQNVWNSRGKTTASLANAINKLKQKPNCFVTMSGVGIYKPSPDKAYTEQSEIERFDFLSELCQEWEKAARLTNNSETRHAVVRSGVVLGRDGGMIQQLFLPFYLGLGGPVASGEQYLPWIHINDITRLILFIIESNRISGIINAVAPEQITNKQFTKAFAKALVRPAIFPLPKFVLDLVFSEERAKMLTEGQRVVPDRAPKLGFKYLYPSIDLACSELVNSAKPKS